MRSFENKYGRNRELYTPRAAAIRPPSLHVPDAARRSIGCRLQDSTKDGVVLYPSGRGPNRHRTPTKPLPGRSPRALKCPALTHTHARNQRIPTRALLPGVRSCSDRIKTKTLHDRTSPMNNKHRRLFSRACTIRLKRKFMANRKEELAP